MPQLTSRYGRFYQIGYVTRDIEAASTALQRRMGAVQIDMIREMRDGRGNPVALRHVAHLAVPGLEVELIEPRLTWDSIYLEALPDTSNAVGLHHLGFLLPDQTAWDAAVGDFEAMATPIVAQGETPDVRFAYFDTRRQAGHYSEIVLRFNPATARPLP